MRWIAHGLSRRGANTAILSGRRPTRYGARASPPVARRGSRATANPAGTSPCRTGGSTSARSMGYGPAGDTRTGSPAPSRCLFGAHSARPRDLPQPSPMATPTKSLARRDLRVLCNTVTVSGRCCHGGVRAKTATDLDLSPARLGQPLVLSRILVPNHSANRQ